MNPISPPPDQASAQHMLDVQATQRATLKRGWPDHVDFDSSPAKKLNTKPSIRDILKRNKDDIHSLAIQYKNLSPCEPCKALDLTYDSFVIDPRPTTIGKGPGFLRPKSMGSYREIEARAENCGLCRLLSASLTQGPGGDGTTTEEDREAECLLSWRIDGREHIAATETGPARSINRTRRLAIEWTNTHKHVEPSYIVLVAPNGRFVPNGIPKDSKTSEKSTLFLGRQLTSVPEDNVELVKEWLHLCQSEHKGCQIDRTMPRYCELLKQPWFQVIDVDDMKLAKLPQSASYLALSYTWGANTQGEESAIEIFKATAKNASKLWKKDGIARVLHELPKAIQNAIAFTQHFKFKYLWIDSLCIVQLDKQSWKYNSRYMDLIYGHAELTICAADGDGAEGGLQALFGSAEDLSKIGNRETVGKQMILPYTTSSAPKPETLDLMLSWTSESYIKFCRWNNRAWTFQERMVSPRCLICVSGRVYYQCQTAAMSEDIYSDEKTNQGTAGWSIELYGNPAHTLTRLDKDPIGVFKTCLKMYTTRNLTYAKDTLEAFNGIGNVMMQYLGHSDDDEEDPALLFDREVESTLTFGLPASHFDYALLWQPEEPAFRRDLRNEDVAHDMFPSWSWSGWICKAGMSYRRAAVAGPEINLHEWIQDHTWITWYIRNEKGQLRLVWDPKRYRPYENIPPRWKGYNSPPTGWPSKNNKYPEFDFHGRPFRMSELRGRTHAENEEDENGFKIIVEPYMNGNIQKAPSDRRHPLGESISLLQFFTWHGRFYVHVDPADIQAPSTPGKKSSGLRKHLVLDRNKDAVGIVWLDEMRYPENRDKAVTYQEEFIAISHAIDFDESETGSWNMYVEDDTSTVPWQLYNVLLIDKKDPRGNEHDNISYRKGLGKIYIKAFELSCPEEQTEIAEEFPNWKEIVLG